MDHTDLFENLIVEDICMEVNAEIEIYDNGDYLELGKLFVPKNIRNSGIGTKMMLRFIDYADNNRRIIRLTPAIDFGGTSLPRLYSFYSRFGFKKNHDIRYKDSMVRYPIEKLN